MKHRLIALVCALCLSGIAPTPAFATETAAVQQNNAVYLGVENYGALGREDMARFRHRFYINGQVVTYTVSAGNGAFSIQNTLQEASVYHLIVQNHVVTAAVPAAALAEGGITRLDGSAITVAGHRIPLDSARIYRIDSAAGGASVSALTASALQAGQTVRVYQAAEQYLVFRTFVAQPYRAPVSGTPGLKTIKNLLATALTPVGTTLYVYGGAWNWQDTGASVQAATIGLPQSWVEFFQRQGADYTYKNSAPSASYYPFGRWNQYYFAGADCSGYVGWVIYNVMHTQSGGAGYVQDATTMAQSFAGRGWGTKTQSIRREDFRPGDIMSMNGHVWICLGACADGSLVILHSTPSSSVSGSGGGGVQINGLGDSENCQAVQLARAYMSKYYPQWYSRYHAVYKNYTSYTSLSGSVPGKFSWTMGSALTDPDGYCSMTAEEILADLFGETQVVTVSASAGGTVHPSGAVQVARGGSQRFVAAPEAGYTVGAVYLDGNDITAQLTNGCFTLTDVQQPHTVQVDFRSGGTGFTDVSAGTYFYDAVNWAVEAGMVQGTSPALFRPDAGCTRAQAVTMLWRAAGMPTAEGAARFDDVPENQYYAPAVQWAAGSGVTQGTAPGVFSPDARLTRGQAVTLLWRARGCPEPAGSIVFTDVPPGSYACKAITWATEQGITRGASSAAFEPDASCTRAQFVTFLHRLYQNMD